MDMEEIIHLHIFHGWMAQVCFSNASNMVRPENRWATVLEHLEKQRELEDEVM